MYWAIYFLCSVFSQKALAVAWKICRKKVTVKNGISVSPLRTWNTSTFLKQFIAELLISPEMNLCKSKVFHHHAFAFDLSNPIPMGANHCLEVIFRAPFSIFLSNFDFRGLKFQWNLNISRVCMTYVGFWLTIELTLCNNTTAEKIEISG